MQNSWEQEQATGERFEFGRNWQSFLNTLDEARIEQARQSLRDMLAAVGLDGRSFLDVGCGSGLFSLAAQGLGATVHSFDYDPQSVACTTTLRERFFPGSPNWRIESGSVLDKGYLNGLGLFDVVYSWGVLHHTGAMWQAIENVLPLVRPGGQLFIAIYNDCDWQSRLWTRIKRLYNKAPAWGRLGMVLAYLLRSELPPAVLRLLHGMSPLPCKYWREHRKFRGMSKWHDYVDWVGGYPFEVAKPHEIFDFVRARGFTLTRLVTPGPRHFCNEFVFQREDS